MGRQTDRLKNKKTDSTAAVPRTNVNIYNKCRKTSKKITSPFMSSTD